MIQNTRTVRFLDDSSSATSPYEDIFTDIRMDDDTAEEESEPSMRAANFLPASSDEEKGEPCGSGKSPSPRDRQARRTQKFALQPLSKFVLQRMTSEDGSPEARCTNPRDDILADHHRMPKIITPEKKFRRSIPFTDRVLYNFDVDADDVDNDDERTTGGDLSVRGSCYDKTMNYTICISPDTSGRPGAANSYCPPVIASDQSVTRSSRLRKFACWTPFFFRQSKRMKPLISTDTATTAATTTIDQQLQQQTPSLDKFGDSLHRTVLDTSQFNLLSPTSFATTNLSSWKSEWGPGQQLMKKSRRRWPLFTMTRHLDRPTGSFLEAIRTFRRMSKPLRQEKFSHLLKSVRALGSLQEAASDPYPPKNLIPVDLESTGGQILMREMHFHFILSVAVYPPEHVNKHYGMKIEATNMVEFVREILTGRPDVNSDDVVIIDYLEKAAVNRPAYCLLVDHSRKRILLILRGSVQFSDIATDVQCEILPTTRTHDGFERAASWFDEHLRTVVLFLRRSFATYTLGLCGHSLGGAVASLLCMRWLNITEISGQPPSRPMIKAYSFGAPCVCTPDVSSNYSRHIVSVTNGRDIVSRLSEGSVNNMAAMLMHICENTRLSRQNGDRKHEIEASVKNAKRACSDANLMGRTRKSLAAHELMDVVYDATEYLESLLEQKSEDASKLADQIHLALRNKQQSTAEMSVAEVPAQEDGGGSSNRSRGGEEMGSPRRFLSTGSGTAECNRSGGGGGLRPQRGNNVTESGKECEYSKRQRCKKFLTGMTTARKPLLDLLAELRSLERTNEHHILVPAGKWYLFIPALHFLIAGRPLPAHLGPGGFGMFDVSSRKAEICSEMVFRRRALVDHFPYYINFALGCPLGMNIPDTLANEMERSLTMGVDFEVRPEWGLPHFGLRHRLLKSKQNSRRSQSEANHHRSLGGTGLPNWALKLRENTVALPKYVAKMINHSNSSHSEEEGHHHHHHRHDDDEKTDHEETKRPRNNKYKSWQSRRRQSAHQNQSQRDVYDSKICKFMDISYPSGNSKKSNN